MDKESYNFTSIGNEYVSEGIFERFPELIPCLGDNFVRKGVHKKMLLVGESNYFGNDVSNDVSVFRDAEKWYNENTDKLIPEEKKKAVSCDIGYKTFNKVFDLVQLLKSRPLCSSLDDFGDYSFWHNCTVI